MTKSYYTVYGLHIESEIEISEFQLIEYENLNDNKVSIKYGVVPEKYNDDLALNQKINVSKNEIWFHIDKVASYYISNGNMVTVQPCENADMKLLKVYLMCSCLGFIMIQRNMVAIHGGVVEMNNKAMIFTGDRGAGKSTLTTALREKGYKFISDDVAAVKLENRIPYINPGFPYQKLCEDAMNNFGYDKNKYTSFSSDGKVKYIVNAHDEFISEPRELLAICEITVGEVGEVTIEEYRGSEKINKIIANIYRGEYLNYLGGVAPPYFKQIIDISKNIKFYKITRPKNKFTVDEQIELIEREVIGCIETAV